jgi:hypothetical protein
MRQEFTEAAKGAGLAHESVASSVIPTVKAQLAWMGRARQIADVASGETPLALAVYFGRLAHTLL